MTTSEFARKALGIPEAGGPSFRLGHCMFCGRKIALGEHAAPFLPSKNFMDAAALTHRARPGGLCGDCAALSTKAVMMLTQNCVITSEGIFSLASSGAKKHFLLQPPAPPIRRLFLGHDTPTSHLAYTDLSVDFV